MPIFTKKSDGTWSTNAKKVFIKAADGLWKSATRVLAKTASGWVQMWPGDAPANNPNDPVNIRLNGYNGTVATSPQYINTVLYGHDNNGASIIGATPITITNRRMQVATDDTGQTDREQVESSDVYDLTSNSETDVAYKRFYADGWWLFYQLEETNVWATTKIYSANPIKIIKQAPTFNTASTNLVEGTGLNPLFTLNFSFSDTWWKSARLYDSYIKWWQNTSKSPGGTLLKTTYIDDISGLSTTRNGGLYEEYDGSGTTVSGSDYYTAMGGVPSGQYIVAEIVLFNSYTDHYGSGISTYFSSGDKPVITAVSVTDENGNGVMDNQSTPRIMSDGYLYVTATVDNASASTYYLLEPRFYNNNNGNYYRWNSTTLSDYSSWPDDLTPTSSSLSGTTATVTWRIDINADLLYGIAAPTIGTGTSSRWSLEFRLSARASSSSTNASASYFDGIATLGASNVYIGGIDLPAMINIAPSSAMNLNVSSTVSQVNSPVTFSISTTSYPSGYSSYPRRYYINYGDNTNSGWQTFATGTNNPSVSNISKTYTSTGTYTATLIWEPQGYKPRSTTSRSITVSPASSAPTSVSVANVTRYSNTQVKVDLSHSGGSGPYYQMYWVNSSTTPVTTSYDAASNSSSSSISDVFSPTHNYTAYFYVRSSSENIATTFDFGSATAGTYSAYSNLSPQPSYTFTHPSGSISIPSSATAGTTLQVTPSISGSPSPNISYEWQYFEGGMIGWVTIATGTSYTPPSNYVSLYGSQLRCYATANNGVSSSQGVESFNAAASTTVSAPATKLATPTNVSASDTRTDGIQISWTNVSNASSYGVWWGGVPSYDNSPDFGGPNNNGGVSITSSPFLDTGAPIGSRNYYVQAFPSTSSTTFLKSDWSAGDSGTRLEALSKLSTPTGVSASDTRTDGVLVSWNAVSGAAYYGVWYGGAPGYDSTPDFGGPNNPTLITGTSYLDTAIGTGVTRDYYVQAFRTNNPTGTKSDWSAGDSGTRVAAATVPGAPTGLYTTNVSSSGATINWSPPSSNGGSAITRYEVNRDGFAFFNVGNVTQYFYTLSQGTYTIGVRAVNSVGAGSAATISVTIPAAATAPATPTGVSLTGSGLVSWNASSGAVSYDVLNYTDRTGSPTNTTNRLGPYTTNVTGTSLQLGSSQGYVSPNNWARVQVRAVGSTGLVSTYSAWVPSSTTYT
jgi:hypothetical protein